MNVPLSRVSTDSASTKLTATNVNANLATPELSVNRKLTSALPIPASTVNAQMESINGRATVKRDGRTLRAQRISTNANRVLVRLEPASTSSTAISATVYQATPEVTASNRSTNATHRRVFMENASHCSTDTNAAVTRDTTESSVRTRSTSARRVLVYVASV